MLLIQQGKHPVPYGVLCDQVDYLHGALLCLRQARAMRCS